MQFRINNLNINILLFSNNKKSSQISANMVVKMYKLYRCVGELRFNLELGTVKVRGRTAAVHNSAPYGRSALIFSGLAE